MISMLVVAFVTAAMITVLSAFSGIEELVSDLFSNFDAPLTIVPSEGKNFSDTLLTDSWFSTIEGLGYHTRIIEEDAWLNYSENNTVATIKGVEADYSRLTSFDSLMYIGDFTLMNDSNPCAVAGLGIRSELLIPVSEEEFPVLEVNAPIKGRKLSRYRENAFTRLYIPVSGVFSANAELDMKYVFVPLSFARELFGMPNDISAIEVGPDANTKIETLQQTLREKIPPGLNIQSRFEKNALIYQTNASEKWATFLILLFILIIACFNIIASLTMLIIEKKKDIYVLSSLGMTRSSIRRIFIKEGILINIIGALTGTFLGLSLCFAQQKLGLIKMAGAVVEYYPVLVKPIDVLGIFFTVVLVGSAFCVALVRTLLSRFAWNSDVG
jgi:lipoprotein-releasing system permease protein